MERLQRKRKQKGKEGAKKITQKFCSWMSQFSFYYNIPDLWQYVEVSFPTEKKKIGLPPLKFKICFHFNVQQESKLNKIITTLQAELCGRFVLLFQTVGDNIIRDQRILYFSQIKIWIWCNLLLKLLMNVLLQYHKLYQSIKNKISILYLQQDSLWRYYIMCRV